MSFSKLSHLDSGGNAHMVDVSHKKKTLRVARAQAEVVVSLTTLDLIQNNLIKKGDVITVAQFAGIMGSKQTGHLIPLCHPISIDQVEIDIQISHEKQRLFIKSKVTAYDKTGVEMEALTAVSIAALTIYDMIKSVEKKAVIEGIRLVEKTGGKSGDFRSEPDK